MCASSNRFKLMTIYLIQKFKFELLRFGLVLFGFVLVLFCACSLLQSFRLNANHLIRHIHIHIASFRCTNWNLIDSRFRATVRCLSKRSVNVFDWEREKSEEGKEEFPNGNSIEYFKTWKLILVSLFIEMRVYSFGSEYNRPTSDGCVCEREKERDRGSEERQIEQNHPVISISKFRHNQTKLTLVHYYTFCCSLKEKSLRVCQHRNVTQQQHQQNKE